MVRGSKPEEQQLQIYKKRSKEVIMEEPHDPSHNISSASSNPSPSIDNMDLPIALQKDACSCIKHPNANYVSYSTLSPSIGSFSIALSSVSTPNSVSKALSQPQC